ncbi:MAG: 1-acyl-sn-glycerol-3-phosphate acyltransferase [Bacteroidales bacterium]|jgi:1-acyl-sn-glycerol-3-phosphate acyltransferase|nr:1-acyl-sn-glycerol-3-phosphate acyltransferase [Bacteroidales bacterium]HOL97442.1 1-acyl-sn-glycerol-3-phosphate acyltransferase [Bacteroidales bacterium]HOM36038.1 1-acyl-sn-glycerol-3-phosphate acyltransferase [Bacteroidales bacterium]HPD23348.1 1-acyl-sn-glycerol-3-phosphate acyltransferase [Bacteroidales bacterium]HRS99716.1 1-acyl-sn-glycerol-3-phosphate acyltransferase [Bacteroidales bacterium]
MEKQIDLNKYRHLYKFSWTWKILSYYVIFLHKLFYKNIIVEGLENIPKDGPLIFAPNHQNALMDPLAVLFTCNRQIVFMARADVFKNKFIASILHFLKIIPVFRIRDGKENLANNDITFNIAVKVLESKQNVGIFPEAKHTNKRRLLDLKKGIPRLAFLAEEKNNFELEIKIIPVGIYYSNYNKMRGVLHVRYGNPIKVSDLKNEYLNTPQKAYLTLRDRIEEELRPLMIDIRSLELYDMYESLRTFNVKNLIRKFKFGKINQLNKFKADKITIKALETYEKEYPEKMLEIKNLLDKYELLKSKYKISNQSVEKPKLSLFRMGLNTLIMLVCLPFFIYGLINNLFVYFIPQFLVKKIKDKQFHSSVKFVWAVFVIPVFYILQTLIFGIFSNNIWLTLSYFISLPLSGLLARVILEWYDTFIQDWRVLLLRKFNPNDYETIKQIHKNLELELDLIINHWNRS